MSIKVKGARELNQRLTDASGKIDKETITVLRKRAVVVRRKQKSLAPKKTTKMAKSITYRIRGTSWRRTAQIGPKLAEDYPLYQELGTARMSANPFVEPSVQGEAEALADGLDGIVPKVLR